jgi:putative hemolysin
MLELVHSNASVFTLPCAERYRPNGALVAGLAQTPDELEAVGHFRDKVLAAEFGVITQPDDMDRDEVDAWCDHLIVKDVETDVIVGTYRILMPQQARQAGGYCSERAFDACAFDAFKDGLLEFGQACIHEDDRNGSVLMMLWSGLAEILRRGCYEHVLGCVSISLQDGGSRAASVWQQVCDQVQTEGEAHTLYPRLAYPLVQCTDNVSRDPMPASLRGYLTLGGRVCGAPAWNRDFNSADFPVLLSISRMGMRYRRYFGLL